MFCRLRPGRFDCRLLHARLGERFVGGFARTAHEEITSVPECSSGEDGSSCGCASLPGHWTGAALLLDALRGAVAAEIAAHALLVDAKDKSAARFYRHHGCIASPAQPRLFFLPLAGVKALTA